MGNYLLNALIIICLFPFSSFSQSNSSPKEETRATWVATVYNLDWPMASSAPPSFQKSDMVTLFTNLKKSGINTIYFQVRTYADAMYDSNYEPWSRYLTGTQGQAPNPFWDPLSYAIKLAHDNGMELHAWVNPYRARTNPGKITSDLSNYPELFSGVEGFSYSESANVQLKNDETTAIDHVTNLHPDWILDVGTVGILNPGLDEVVDYITDVVMDIVNRYDIDGVHFDDYFYPYPPNEVSTQDQATFEANGRGIANKSDWRRDNINRMIKSVYDSMMTVKPFLKYGVSPFGIWKSGTPANASGMNAYSTIYADAPAWLNGEYVDYLAPQLYWPFVGMPVGQDFGLLAGWWGTIRNGRHIYPGHGLYRADKASFSGGLFKATEVPRQIRFIRNDANLQGSVFFRARNISTYKSQGFSDSLKNNYYKHPAIQPKMDWKTSITPATPQNLAFTLDKTDVNQDKVNLTWSKVNFVNNLDSLVKYAVYRVTSDQQPSADTIITNVKYLLAVTGVTNYTDVSPGGINPNWYFVTAINRNADESEVSNMVQTDVLTTLIEENSHVGIPEKLSLDQNFPNPFNPSTTISFSVHKSEQIQLQVFDMLGREVALLANGMFAKGQHSIRFDASALSSGIYFYTLKSSDQSLTKRMVLLK